MIQSERIRRLNERELTRGRYVLYWMQQAQRAGCNHALEHAVRRADELALPVAAVFGITQRFPEAGERHYRFMLEGLQRTRQDLADEGIQLVVLRSPPREAALRLADAAALVVTDRGYLRCQRQWREHVARRAGCPVVQVETDVVVPVETASDKEEYAARTIRPRIHERLEEFLVPLEESAPARDSLDMRFDGEPLEDVAALLEELRISRDVAAPGRFRGGADDAWELLEEFVAEELARYDQERSDPGTECLSHMSPYLHFGQISPLAIALRVRQAAEEEGTSADAYLEELIVRRELSMNYCQFSPRYDGYDALPDWARETLREHEADTRPYLYGLEQLEQACTHDAYWNAAQREMVLTGKMHAYMRMYWGKKILEWSPTAREGFQRTLHLNNKYELDGRDPNSFAGVAWCFGKHDQAWRERPIFGKVRYMNAAGLDRKFDMDAYVRRVDRLAEQTGASE
ncbi:MAG: deoxyribodipyrimidine photo-lyase [Candidatus Brocadiia bacterium]